MTGSISDPSIHPIGESSSSSSSPTSLQSPLGAPSINCVEVETVQSRLGKDLGDDIQRKTLECNWKMKLGIAVGVIVGVVILGVVAAGIVASHGAAIPLFGVLAAKISAGSAIAAKGIVSGLGIKASAAIVAKIASGIEALGMGAFLLGVGGKIGGGLIGSGEAEAMDKFLNTSSKKVKDLETKILGEGNKLSEKEISEHISDKQSSVLSSQAGRNFAEDIKKLGLHYVGSPLRSPAKFFGHFWAQVQHTSLKSISDKEQYNKYNQKVEQEIQLKENSCDGDQAQENLNTLNGLREDRIEQLVKKNKGYDEALSLAPESLVYDRNISRLQLLLKKASSEEDRNSIKAEINIQKSAKNALLLNRIQRELDETMPKVDSLEEDTGTKILNTFGVKTTKQNAQEKIERLEALKEALTLREDQPIKSLDTIQEDIAQFSTTNNLSDEHKGQILEAIGILLEGNQYATLSDVNNLAKDLSNKLDAFKQANNSAPDWQTRNSSIEYAQWFTQKSQKTDTQEQIEPVIEPVFEATDQKSFMTRGTGSFYGLKILDAAISLIHMLPVPGSAALSLGLTAGAVALEKKGVKVEEKKSAVTDDSTVTNVANIAKRVF